MSPGHRTTRKHKPCLKRWSERYLRDDRCGSLAISVPRQKIERLIALAASAPSGANKQPWHFVAVQNPEVKRQIRLAAEEEERAFYGGRASDQWLEDLKPFGTDWEKPF